jgi:hypothetical protein
MQQDANPKRKPEANPVARSRGKFQDLSRSQQKVAEHLLTRGLDVTQHIDNRLGLSHAQRSPRHGLFALSAVFR